ALQLHGAESPEFCSRLSEAGYRVIKAVPLKNAASLEEAGRFPPAIPLLFDSYSPDELGGTGKVANLELAAQFVRGFPERRVILAGGLRAENVTDAIRRVRPFAIDVASGVEVSDEPRRKDLSRLEALFTALAAAGWRPEPAPKEGLFGHF